MNMDVKIFKNDCQIIIINNIWQDVIELMNFAGVEQNNNVNKINLPAQITSSESV